MLKNRVFPWINSLPGNQAVTLPQDGATAHTAKMVQAWCKDNIKSFRSKEPLLFLILIRWTLGYDPSWRERPACVTFKCGKIEEEIERILGENRKQNYLCHV